MLAATLTACGGSGSGGWVPADIDEQQTLDRLGAAGYTKLCSAFDDYVRDTYRSNRLVQAACTAHALQTTEDAAACGAAVDACLDDLPPVVEQQLDMILGQAGCSAIQVMQNGCASPISRLTTCLDDLGARVDQVQLSLTCAAVGSPVPQDWWQVTPPSSCTALTADC